MEVSRLLLYALAVLTAYLAGAVPFGYLLAKYVKGIDVRTVGSGNIGATNVARVAGPRMGILAFLLDVAKGFVAVTIIPFSAYAAAEGGVTTFGVADFLRTVIVHEGFADLRLACGLASVSGHVWTVFLGFRGGKGVATSLGMLLGLAPWPTLIAVFLWAVVARASGFVSLASVLAAAALPVAFVALEGAGVGEKWRLLALMLIVSAIVIARHRGNISRLRDGTEPRVSFKRPGAVRRRRRR